MLENPMPNMKNIKTKIDSVSNMKQLFDSMESADCEKLEKAKKQIACYKSFMQDFFGIVWSIDANLFNIGHSRANDRKLILVFSTDKWFCGNYNSKLFRNIYAEYSQNIDKVDVFCVGKKAFEFFAKKWFNIVWYLKLADEFTQDDLSEIYDYFVSSISSKNYWDIAVYLNSVRSKINSEVINYNLYPVDENSLWIFMESLWMKVSDIATYDWVNLWSESEEFRFEMEKQLLQYMLYGAALQNRMAELTSRIWVLQNIKNTSDFIVKDLRLSFNRMCQSLLTKEISNIMTLKTAY